MLLKSVQTPDQSLYQGPSICHQGPSNQGHLKGKGGYLANFSFCLIFYNKDIIFIIKTE